MAARDRQESHLRRVRDEFGQHPADTGGTEVQVAQLTQRIAWLNNHMRRHHGDVATRRGLDGLVARRRKLLKYLRGAAPPAYHALIYRLGIKDQTYVGSKFPMPIRKAAG